MVSRDGVAYALLEDKKTKEGYFVKAGDTFRGFTVDAIKPDGITFKTPDRRTLAMRDDYSLIPLDKNTYPAADDRMVSAEKVSYADAVNSVFVARTLRFSLSNWVSGEDIEKLKNEAFEGKISPEEFERRTGGTSGIALRSYDWQFSTALTNSGSTQLNIVRD